MHPTAVCNLEQLVAAAQKMVYSCMVMIHKIINVSTLELYPIVLL